MAVGMDVVLAGCTLIFAVYSVTAELPRKKFEYKLSLKGPHLIQSDGSIPFWTHGGNAIASDQSIRVTPSLRSQKGWVWSKNTNPHEHWEVEATFRISGRGRVGADGLAIWYTTQQGMDGPVFGGKDQWNGLGVFFDSFDNDGQHNNPYVMVMLNDGTKQYDHNSDGQHQQLGGCLRDFRNKPFPVKAKIEYYKNALTLSIHNGMTNNKDDYEICVRAENVNLPRNGYFGVSAATGGLADDHDLVSFITHSLTVPVTGVCIIYTTFFGMVHLFLYKILDLL
ncbi:protein ERGIC-53 isoform X2 [Lingula anatina]|uniref:Protein ERGIC-53 isoform X2 n=1 Tax=Lingula anatina TaxID=7574 RepID=A0A1S3JEA9_LINAN|nr:protein ERGIC-53 isoform X2 [Lingula anatina]|eukprot:XP_013408224.1 protein ERGIC-53 isoform X2 [Lingula anatina]